MQPKILGMQGPCMLRRPGTRPDACISILQRPTSVKIKAQDLQGAKMNVTLTGWQARIFQHEYDHLQVHLLSH